MTTSTIRTTDEANPGPGVETGDLEGYRGRHRRPWLPDDGVASVEVGVADLPPDLLLAYVRGRL